MKQTSIKYRLSNIKTFLYHVGARTHIISPQNHLQHSTRARWGRMVLCQPQVEINAAHAGIPLRRRPMLPSRLCRLRVLPQTHA